METDAELLHRFVATSDEIAFRSLVERHAGMVYGVALRIIGDATMAEEISQSVFTILARKARGLGQKKISGWLHDAVVLEARNFARKAARYRRVVSAYQHEMTDPFTETAWESISPHLDEALTRLPDRSKNMVIMRFYERLSFKEISTIFGKSEAASRKEVERSLQQLGSILNKRGITTTGAALSTLLAAQTLCVSPASASALAAASLQSIPLSRLSFGEKVPDWMQAGVSAWKTMVLVLIALTPAVVLWAKNMQLEERLRELSSERPLVIPIPASLPNQMVPPVSRPDSVANGATEPQHTEAKALVQAEEQAALELTRISLNVPGLTDDQKSRIKAVFEKRNTKKQLAKLAAFGSGAVRRYALAPDALSDADKALLYSMEPEKIAPFEDAEIQSVLSDEQFDTYVQTEEAKRISDAESAASDVLKAVGLSLDLSPSQKDKIFQALAALELNGPPMTVEQQAEPFGQRNATEEARDQIVLGQLSAEQAEVYLKFREDRKLRHVEFLKNLSPKESEN